MDQIAVIAELENIGTKFEFASDKELRIICPFHEDTNPSLLVNTETRVFNCPACQTGGDFVTLLARLLKCSRADILAELSTRYVLDSTKIVEIGVIEGWHDRIWSAGPLLKALRDRGVTDKIIRKRRYGFEGNRIMLPIPDGVHFVNVRQYLPGAPGKLKMRNMKGRGKPIRIYPDDQLRFDELVITGGEIKADVAAEQLNPRGIGVITATGGEGNWEPHLTKRIAGKSKVWVCLDTDDAGRLAADRLCGMIYTSVGWLGDVLLPLDRDTHPKGDINDFIAQEHGDLYPLLQECSEWKPLVKKISEDETPDPVTLSEAVHAKNTGKKISMRVMAAAVDTAPYTVPSEVQTLCTLNQPQCSGCPIFAADKPSERRWRISPEHPAILKMVGASIDKLREATMDGLGIPLDCKVVGFNTLAHYNVEDARLSPQLEISNRVNDRSMQPALLVGNGVELNEPYIMTGRMHPHPKTQQATMLISNYEHAADALSSYKCTDLDELEIFQPTTTIEDKLKEIYADLSSNVTRIYQREDLHLIIDLAYHSPLMLNFDGQEIKGWVEVLIVGDSGQGKSEASLQMMKHYGLGERVDCKNATVAGLLGGLQQIGTRWFVSWGVIPTHDKRLVILEELKGASTEVISKLTDMRSSGIAQIPKIEKRQTHARTRLIAPTNPRTNQKMASFNFGIDAIKEVVGNLEDIRRFDMALIVAAGQIDPKVLNTLYSERTIVEHKFTSELCRKLILWTWTRSKEQVIFPEETTSAILRAATSLSDMFTDAIPLVDRGSMRNKVARLAASLAGRLYSCSEDGESLIIRPEHVLFIEDMLKRIYSDGVFGYNDLTEAIKLQTELVEPEVVKTQIRETPFPRDFIKQIMHTTEIELIDIQDWCGWSRFEAQTMLSVLVRKHAVVREDRHYRKTPEFITLLKKMLEENDFPERPDFIKEKF